MPAAAHDAPPEPGPDDPRERAELLRDVQLLRQWREAFIATSRGIAIVDATTGLARTVNPAFAAMHGGRVEDFEGRPIAVVLSEEWKLRVPALIEQVQAAGFSRMEVEHVRLDGTAFVVDVEVVASSGPDGRPTDRISWYEDLTERHAAEAAHRDAIETLTAAFAEAPSGVAVIGTDARFRAVNAALCTMLGRTEEELVGRPVSIFSHPDDDALTARAYAALITSREPVSAEKRYLRPGGEIVFAATRGIAIRDEHGTPQYFVSHFQDITARKQAEREQAQAIARFEGAFADAPIGMALVALDGTFKRVNRMMCEITGFPEHELLQRTFQQGSHPEDLELDESVGARLARGEMPRHDSERRYFTATGEMIWIKRAGSMLRDIDGRPTQFIIHVEDVTERKRLDERLLRLAEDDPLTGLWNRRRFESELTTQIARCQRYDESAALLMIDLDGFKPVNDRLGHHAGDELLQRVAAALRDRLRTTDAVARVGGDEFQVLLTNVTPDQAAMLAGALAHTVAAVTIEREGEHVGVTASIGLAVLDDSVAGLDEVTQRADAAMYEAKRAARGARVARAA